MQMAAYTKEDLERLKNNTLEIPEIGKSEETETPKQDAKEGLRRATGITEDGTIANIEGSKAPAMVDTSGNKEKLNWTQKQKANAIENASAPEQRFDLAGQTLERADEQGLAANRAIQNTEIPKWKRATINDVLFNPEYDGIRDSIVSQAVNARGANFLKGLAGKDSNYASAIDQYNKEQAQRYSNAVADRDTRAADVQMSDIEAANKRDVGETLQRADFNVDRELDRAGLLFDTETKRQVLLKMGENAKDFDKLYPNPEDRMLLTAYQQYLSGDATMLDSLLSVYGPALAEKLTPLVNKVLGVDADSTDELNSVAISFGGHDYTAGEIENLGWSGLWDAMQRAGLTDEEIENNISTLERKYGITNDLRKLRNKFETEKNNAGLQTAYDQAQIDETNTAAETIASDMQSILDNGKLSEKDKVKKLEQLKTTLEDSESKGLYVETEKMKETKANLEQSIAMQKLARDVQSINNPIKQNVKLAFDKNGKLNESDAKSSLNYLASLNWWKTLINPNTGSVTNTEDKLDAVRGTNGYQAVVDMLNNKSVKDYAASDLDIRKLYKGAVDKFVSVFGGSASNYGFANFR